MAGRCLRRGPVPRLPALWMAVMAVVAASSTAFAGPVSSQAAFEDAYRLYRDESLNAARQNAARVPLPVADAEPHALKAIDHARAAFGPDATVIIELAVDVATARLRTGRPEDALAFLVPVLQEQETLHGENSATLIPIHVLLGEIHWDRRLKTFQSGADHFSKAIKIAADVHGPESPEVAAIWTKRGIAGRGGYFAAYEPSFREALTILKKRRTTDARPYIETLLDYGDQWMRSFATGPAVSQYRQALQWQQQSAPQTDDLLPRILGSLAHVYTLAGYPDEAEKHAAALIDHYQTRPAVRDSHAKVLSRTGPRYPEDANEQRLEGTVVVGFSINALGQPVDIAVIDSTADVFNKAAITCIEKWRYEPASRDGRYVRQDGMTVQLSFQLAD